MKCAMQYAAIEFTPITTSGNAHLLKPFTSITQLNAARNKKQIPPLKMVHDGVQMRFTTGQMCEKCSANPRAVPATPAISNFVIGIFGRDSRNHFPAIKPRIIVPSVGIKLNVRYPPELYSKRFSRGNRFRSHWSKRFPKL